MHFNRNVALQLMIALAIANAGCFSLCGNDVVSEVRSPSGKMKAVVFERDCGATTGSTTQVSLLPSNQSLTDEIGNLYVATTDHGKAPAGAWGGPVVDVSWTDDTHLLLKYDKRASVSKREESLGNFNVRYDTSAP